MAGPRRALPAAVALGLITLTALSVVAAPLASGAGAGWYAYAGGEATSPTSCPETTTTADQCALAQALSLAGGGDTVYLATPGASEHYLGNWSVNVTGTSASAPLTIQPAPGVANPTLDGNEGSSANCPTSSCDGPMLTIGDGYVYINGVTFQDADNTTTYLGGAIDNSAGGTLNVSGSTFSANTTPGLGGAIDNSGGTLSVSGSRFSSNSGGDGGAIDNGYYMSSGTLSVNGSTFSANSANYNGGAIDNGDFIASGTLSVSGSTFSANSASHDGGAIDNGDGGGNGTLGVDGSTFTANSAGALGDGGAIDNGDNSGRATASVSVSTFLGNSTGYHGGAIDNGDGGSGTLTVLASTFSANSASGFGRVIDNGDDSGKGTVWAAADLFDGLCDQASGTWNDEGYNVGSDTTCMSSTLAIGDVNYGSSLTPLLGPLADNGGPTETIALLGGNPAIGAIPNLTSVTVGGSPVQLCPTTDQRGVASLPGAACNAGAVQEVALYAYAPGGAASPTSCPQTTSTADQCTLAQGLSLAAAGDTVYLATPGASGHYVGNWSVNAARTSAAAPLTVEPAAGVANPTLDGNGGSNSSPCATTTTSGCDGPILTIGDAYVDISGVTFADAHNTTTDYGGAIDNSAGGTLSVSGSAFSGNSGYNGGAIDNGDVGDGTLTVSGSTFLGNSAFSDGGAIDNGDFGGSGALTVSASTFSGNSSTSSFGGAIANGDNIGTGRLTVSASTFSGNSARADGGAIDSGDDGDSTLTVSDSTFSANSATSDGGAIDNADDHGGGTLSESASTFSANSAGRDGVTIDNGDHNGTGNVWSAADLFNGGCDQGSGAWHDNGYNVGSDGSCLSNPPVSSDVDAGASLAGLLGPLANNGGPTETLAPLAGNPAIRLVPNGTSVTLDGASVQLCPTTDQRGVTSSTGAPCNAGAVQYVLPVAQTQAYQVNENSVLAQPAEALQAGVMDGNPGATSWTAALSSKPGYGTLSVNSDGSFTYAPNAGFIGGDSFTYTLTDNLGYTSAPATVTIDVVPVFSITVDGSSSATVDYGTAATFAESGVPESTTGTLSFLTTPGGLLLCRLSFPTVATTCTGPADLAAGDYTVEANFDDSATNVTTPATSTVGLDASTVPVAASVSGSQAYGSSSATLLYTDNAPTGVAVIGTLTCSSVGGGPIGATLTASSYTIDSTSCSGLTLTGTASANYTLSYIGLTDGFVVAPVPLTIAASGATFTYGGTVPAITPSYAGFVNGDTPASLTTPPTCSTTATSLSPPGTYASDCNGAVDPNYTISYSAGTVAVIPAPASSQGSPTATSTTTTASLKPFPSAALTHANGALVSFGAGHYVLAGGRAFPVSLRKLTAVEKVDHATVLPAPAGAVAPTAVAPRPGTLLSTKAVDGAGTIYVAGTDGELHGFSTPRQFFADGYDAALVVTVPSLAGLNIGATDGVAGASVNALATRADGAIVDSAGTFYVFDGGRAFGIPSPAALSRVKKGDPAEVLHGPVGPAQTKAVTASGVLPSAPGKVYVSYEGALYLFRTEAQLGADGYSGTAAVPVPGTGGLSVVRAYYGR